MATSIAPIENDLSAENLRSDVSMVLTSLQGNRRVLVKADVRCCYVPINLP